MIGKRMAYLQLCQHLMDHSRVWCNIGLHLNDLSHTRDDVSSNQASKQEDRFHCSPHDHMAGLAIRLALIIAKLHDCM